LVLFTTYWKDDQIKEDEEDEHTALMEEMRNEHNIMVEKPDGRHHSEDLGVNGKIIGGMYLREAGCWGVDWIHLAQHTDC
jgi:hypothetical protein